MKNLALMSLLLVLSTHAFAQTSQTIAAECTTKHTGFDGVGKYCTSKTVVLNAPPNHVFAKNTLKGGKSSAAGRSNHCVLKWSNNVEIIPGSGITQPRTVSLHAKARGPKGPRAGRGWTKCRYTVTLSKYK